MMGPEGMEHFNKQFLLQAEGLGLLNPTTLMSDTTAQEARIPYPNEVGLMKRFTDLALGGISKLGRKFSKVKTQAKEIASKVKGLVRRAHLFAKTQEEKRKVAKKLYHTTQDLKKTTCRVFRIWDLVKNKSNRRSQKLIRSYEQTFPSDFTFFGNRFYRIKENPTSSEDRALLYSPWQSWKVRGVWDQVGDQQNRWICHHASDKKFCVESIKEPIELFGKAPKIYGFDRGGYSPGNIKKAKRLGVKNIGIAPLGKAKWNVSERMSEKIRRERAQVEGVIGSLKSRKYGFNKPNVKSTMAMETSAHRSFLGFNLNKALRKLHQQELQIA